MAVVLHPMNELPLRPDGIVYQHFNTDPAQRVRFIACEPNHLDSLGVDRGSGFEQLEVAPEYDEARALGGG